MAKMTSVYFVRHAQPVHGYADDRTRPLTEEGREDAKAVLAFLRDKEIDCFYSSPYVRSYDTIAEAAAYYGKEIKTDERLREREKGTDGNRHGMFERRWADHDYHEEGGESLHMTARRNMEALRDILQENEGNNIVIGTHGTALSTILHYYDPSYNCDSFMRIIDWMPYIIELDFEGTEVVAKKEHLYIEKKFQGKERADKPARKKLLYATGNPAKLTAMKTRLEPLGLEIIGLQEAEAERQRTLQEAEAKRQSALQEAEARQSTLQEAFSQANLSLCPNSQAEQECRSSMDIPEDGETPLENARQKALSYYQLYHMPLFSCDSGLYIEGIPDEEQPGVHVRNVHGKCLTDEEMLEHYAGLARKYGDLKARYHNAICLVIDERHVYSAMEESMASEPFIISSIPHKLGIQKEGFPLDCLSINIRTGEYYYDMIADELDELAVEDGFLDFFRRFC